MTLVRRKIMAREAMTAMNFLKRDPSGVESLNAAMAQRMYIKIAERLAKTASLSNWLEMAKIHVMMT